jgi:hypothetical protein
LFFAKYEEREEEGRIVSSLRLTATIAPGIGVKAQATSAEELHN